MSGVEQCLEGGRTVRDGLPGDTPQPARVGGQDLPGSEVVFGLIDGLHGHEAVPDEPADGEASAGRIAPSDRVRLVRRGSRDLQLGVVLLAPEPGQRRVGSGFQGPVRERLGDG